MAEPFIGEIRLFAFGLIPKGWAPCNGQLLQVNMNQALYSILGSRFGGNGTTTFALPNLQGRTPIHVSGEYPVGTAGGEATHALTVSEMPGHTHQVDGDSSGVTSGSPEGNVWGTTTAARPIYASTSNVAMNPAAFETTGSSQGHNNMQPYTALTFCIALQGYFPSRN